MKQASHRLTGEVAPALPSFHFRQRSTTPDWGKLRSIDLEHVIREVDIPLLQSIVDDVAFAKVPHDGQAENYAQLAKLSQLLLEYLLHVQSYQDVRLASASDKLAAKRSKIAALYRTVSAANKETKFLKREALRYQTIMCTCEVRRACRSDIHGAAPI
jgi:Iguana/Dzip1-like DAZ-interacting protein N-terminal